MILSGCTGRNSNLHRSPFSRLRPKCPQVVRSRWMWMSKRRRNKFNGRLWKSQDKFRLLVSNSSNHLNYHHSPGSRTSPNDLHRPRNRLPRSDHLYSSPNKANLCRIGRHSCSNYRGHRSLFRIRKRFIRLHHRISTGNHLCHLNRLLLRLAILRINYLPHHISPQGPTSVHLGLRHQPCRVPMAQICQAPPSQPPLFLLQLRKGPLNRVPLLLHTPELLPNTPLNPHLASNNGR